MSSKVWDEITYPFPNFNCATIFGTVGCHYNAVNIFQNIYKRHPIAGPSGRGMGCLLWIQHLNDNLLQFLQSFVQYFIILDCVITTPDCTLTHIDGIPEVYNHHGARQSLNQEL